jgi:hypothetical protein
VTSGTRLLCPSAPCEPGAVLVGVVLTDGRVAFAADRLVVETEFVQVARQGRAPEKRFRFASPCLRHGCAQWAHDRCGVIDSVIDGAEAAEFDGDLPACSIRPECRWFAQAGANACAICPAVITDLREDAVPIAGSTAATAPSAGLPSGTRVARPPNAPG